MIQKASCRMGLGLVLCSALFLWNPMVGMVDLLPDFFGYLLLYFGLYRLSDMNAHIEEARRKFRMLLWVSVGQLFAMWLVYDLIAKTNGDSYNQSVWILVFSFALSFFKWYFLIPAFGDLFEGMERLAEKYQSDRLIPADGKLPSSRWLQRMSTAFVVISTLGATLPELTVLTTQSPNFSFDWHEFIFMFRVIGGGISLLTGLIWLILFVRYFGKALSDKALLARIYEDYALDVLTQTGLLTVRRFQVFAILMQIAIIFAVNLRINYRAVLPGIGLALFACLAVCFARKRFSIRVKPILAASIPLAIISLLQLLFNASYLKLYLPEASLYEPSAFVRFLIVRLLGVAEAALTMYLIWVILQMLLEIVYEHTSVEYDGDVTRTLSNAATARLHREFEKRNTVMFIFFFLAMLGNIIDAFFLLQLPWVWLVSFLLSFVAIWNFFATLHELDLQIRYRYLTDSTNKRE